MCKKMLEKSLFILWVYIQESVQKCQTGGTLYGDEKLIVNLY